MKKKVNRMFNIMPATLTNAYLRGRSSWRNRANGMANIVSSDMSNTHQVMYSGCRPILKKVAIGCLAAMIMTLSKKVLISSEVKVVRNNLRVSVPDEENLKYAVSMP